MSNLMKGLLGGFGVCGGIALLVLFYIAGLIWIDGNVTDPFWRPGLLVVGGFAGIGAAIGAAAALIGDIY